MKLLHCDWAPSLVVEWLQGELEERGIPGSTYAHTLISLLHDHFCPHPLPPEESSSASSVISSSRSASRLTVPPSLKCPSRDHFGDLRDTEELLTGIPYLDADFPDSNAERLRGGNRRARKRYRVRQKHRSFSSEQLQKVYALQCLKSASDEHYDLENLVEELCVRLKLARETKEKEDRCRGGSLTVLAKSLASGCASGSDTDGHSPPASPLTLRENYYADFPALNCPFGCRETRVDCLCVSQEGSTTLDSPDLLSAMPNTICKKIAAESLDENACDSDQNSCYLIGLQNKSNSIKPENQGRPRNIEQDEVFVMDEDTSEGYVGDTSSRDSSEDRDKVDSGLRGSVKLQDGQRCENASAFSEVSDKFLEITNNWKNQWFDESQFAVAIGNHENFEELCTIKNSKGEDSMHIPCRDVEDEKLLQLRMKINTVAPVWGEVQPCSIENKERIWKSFGSSSPQHANLPSGFHPDSSWKFGDWKSHEGETIPIGSQNKDTSYSFMCIDGCTKNFDTFLFEKEKSDVNANRINDLVETSPTPEEEDPVQLCTSFKELFLGKPTCEDTLQWSCSNDTGCIENMTKQHDFSDDNMAEAGSLDSFFGSKHNFNNFRSIIRPIPVGPSGPYADLQHTETSGFTSVPPRDHLSVSSLEDFSDNNLKSANKQSSLACGRDVSLVFSDSSKEDNLLVSPRTHFKPIRKSSISSTTEDGSEETARSVHAELPFQRTGSGALYLESDLIDGSPKKYMVYKEPVSKDSGTEKQSEGHLLRETSFLLIPKFEVVENEKFSQTEDVDESPGDSSCSNILLSHRFDVLSSNFSHELDILDSRNFCEKEYKQPAFFLNTWSNNTENSIQEPSLIEPFLSIQPKSGWEREECWKSGEARNSNQAQIKSWTLHAAAESKSNDNSLSTFSVWSSGPPGFSHSKGIMKELWTAPPERRTEPHDSVSDKDLKATTYLSCCDDRKLVGGEDNSGVSFWHHNSESSTEGYDRLAPEKLPEKDDMYRISIASSKPLHEILRKKNSSNQAVMDDVTANNSEEVMKEDLKDCFPDDDLLAVMDDVPSKKSEDVKEDLDGFCLQMKDGFEWGHNEPDDEGDVDDDDICCKNDDCGWIDIPVEYLDNKLYDELFGIQSSEDGSFLSCSLPDLPFNDGPQGIVKKGNKAYKFHIPKRPGQKYTHPSRRPCSFFLDGNCRRADCKFSHDLGSITCRFWEDGSCLKGDICPFMHGYAPLRRRRRNKSEGCKVEDESSLYGSSFEIGSEADFPSLGSSQDKISDDRPRHLPVEPVARKRKKKKIILVDSAEASKGDRDKSSKRPTAPKRLRHQRYSSSSSTNEAEGAGESTWYRGAFPAQHFASGHEDGTVSDY